MWGLTLINTTILKGGGSALKEDSFMSTVALAIYPSFCEGKRQDY